MLNFRLASFLFVVIGLAVWFLLLPLGIHRAWLLLPVVLYLLLIVRGSSRIHSGFFIPAYCSGDTSHKLIALSFDDGPHTSITPQVLDILKERSVPAAFFLIGRNIPQNEALLRRMDLEGHIIGNHTWSHSFFIDLKSKLAFMYELDQTSDQIQKVIGKRTRYFRPPYGVTTPAIANASRALSYSVIGWNIRSLDTTQDTEKKIVERITAQLKPGAIILFHDTKEKTLNVLKQTLNFAEENGFKVVRLDELLKLPAYA